MDGPASREVPAGAAGTRVDAFLAEITGTPRNQVQRWIRQGRVRLDGQTVKASRALQPGERVDWDPPAKPEETLVPEPGELAVIFEDPQIVVLDKPAGLTVHPGAGREAGTLVHRLLARYPETAGVGGPGRPGIVHRLDKGTTGVIVVARTETAYQRLSADFASRRTRKLYLGIVFGSPPSADGTIEAPIGRHPRRRREMAVRGGGRPSRTEYRRVATAEGISLLELGLVTGRTHQIRVHLKSIGHPLVGDPTYGEARWKSLPGPVRRPLGKFPRPALHAWRLTLRHPVSGEEMLFEAPVPEDFAELWREVTGTSLPVEPTPSRDR